MSRNSLSRRNYANSFYQDHELYQYLGIYQDANTTQIRAALIKKKALMESLVLQQKDIREMSRLFSRANVFLTHPVTKRSYDVFGDADTSTTRLPPPPSARPPPPVSPPSPPRPLRRAPTTPRRHHAVHPPPYYPPPQLPPPYYPPPDHPPPDYLLNPPPRSRHWR